MPIALAFLTRLPWKQIGLGLAVAALIALLYFAPWAYSRGRHSRDAEVAALQKDNETLKENVAFLRASIDTQNAAVIAAKAEGDKRVQEGHDALAAAQKANAGNQATIVMLKKQATRVHEAGEPCTEPAVAGRRI